MSTKKNMKKNTSTKFKVGDIVKYKLDVINDCYMSFSVDLDDRCYEAADRDKMVNLIVDRLISG